MTETFFVAFIVSFLGSIPPGVANLSVLQLSLEGRPDAAVRFSLAAVLVEIPYAIIAIKFQQLLAQSPWITNNFKLIAAIVLLVLGLINLLSGNKKRRTGLIERVRKSGFRKGIIVGILNPMAIPFWIAVTAYLVQHDWVDLSVSGAPFWYIIGLALGSLCLLGGLILLSRNLAPIFRSSRILQKIPGVAFILLGLYSLGAYFHLV